MTGHYGRVVSPSVLLHVARLSCKMYNYCSFDIRTRHWFTWQHCCDVIGLVLSATGRSTWLISSTILSSSFTLMSIMSTMPKPQSIGATGLIHVQSSLCFGACNNCDWDLLSVFCCVVSQKCWFYSVLFLFYYFQSGGCGLTKTDNSSRGSIGIVKGCSRCTLPGARTEKFGA